MKRSSFAQCRIALTVAAWCAVLIAAGCGSSSTPTTTPTTIPAAPALLSVVGGDTIAVVTFANSAGAASYNVYYGTSATQSKASHQNVVSVGSSPYTVTGLTDNQTYSFTVTAVNSTGESGESQTLTATPNPLAAPTLSSAVGGNGQATLTFSSTATPSSYNVYFGTSPTETTASFGAKQSVSSSPAVITGLSNGVAYYFSVTAVVGTQESAASATLPATPAAPPASPFINAATPGDTTVTLALQSPAVGISGYTVY